MPRAKTLGQKEIEVMVSMHVNGIKDSIIAEKTGRSRHTVGKVIKGNQDLVDLASAIRSEMLFSAHLPLLSFKDGGKTYSSSGGGDGYFSGIDNYFAHTRRYRPVQQKDTSRSSRAQYGTEEGGANETHFHINVPKMETIDYAFELRKAQILSEIKSSASLSEKEYMRIVREFKAPIMEQLDNIKTMILLKSYYDIRQRQQPVISPPKNCEAEYGSDTIFHPGGDDRETLKKKLSPIGINVDSMLMEGRDSGNMLNSIEQDLQRIERRLDKLPDFIVKAVRTVLEELIDPGVISTRKK